MICRPIASPVALPTTRRSTWSGTGSARFRAPTVLRHSRVASPAGDAVGHGAPDDPRRSGCERRAAARPTTAFRLTGRTGMQACPTPGADRPVAAPTITPPPPTPSHTRAATVAIEGEES